jgi:two-component system LytT family response regulator
MIKVMIVDDEPLARENLRLALHEFCPQVEVVAECKNGKEALAAVDKYRLDLAFLDIQMPGMSGVEVAENLKKYGVQFVFVTAYDEYAIKAFRLSALDYLLKPVMPAQVIEVIAKATAPGLTGQLAVQLELYKKALEQMPDRIAIPLQDGLEVCLLSDMVVLKADESYTEIYMTDKAKKLVSRKLGELESMLSASGFLRVHKSYLVNEKHIQQYIKGEGGQLKMSNGMTVDVSRRKKEEILNRLKRV